MYSISKSFETLQNSFVNDMFSSGNIEDFFDMGENDSNASSPSFSSFGFGPEWLDLDQAPDSGSSSNIFFIKPLFFEDLKSSALMFLSKDIEEDAGPSKTLMMIQLNVN